MTANDNPIGNRTQTSDTFGIRQYTHNALNEMQSDSRMPRTYDADGNLVFDWRFEYASKNSNFKDCFATVDIRSGDGA